MVLTPEFTISQDPSFIYIKIKCPNVRAQEMEMEISGTEFHFFADPYLLVLNFQHCILDSQNGSAKYDIESGYFSAKLEKAVEGEDFPEIALLSTLKPKQKQAPLIEVIDRSTALEYSDEIDPDPMKYGFNFWASNFFENIEETIPYITDIPNPDSTIVSERREQRIEKENEDFDPDQILLDYLNPQQYDLKEFDLLMKDFTPEESQKLLKIPRQEFLMSKNTAKICFLSIADVVYAGVYDVIMFGFDGSCESHWTIAKISATLSWFDSFENSMDLILTSLRRSLLYPVYKNYDFAKLCWEKTREMFKEGRTPILKCLLRVKQMIEKGEQRWRLNRLYIDPMISWIQELDQSDYNSFTDDLGSAVDNFPPKNGVCEEWCIDLLEKFAEKKKNEITQPIEVQKDINVTKQYIEEGSSDDEF
ncbi:hypothetical protein TRFO_10220 [Tritrichomonas foetus]|uniref:CS domain-containing protein n=1 Tax=Tritrichomonas foetus TaxID=1144522 RepID=A0A1J4JCQ8_9EUKA|nr:hypothetical protein TRFO_10220 [Tritrichomonas foetus]|eukprot:OHS96039.1 hypothetical protein TRFO_10220 [Tritrichomonas foetus]